MADSFNVWPGGIPTSYSGESFPLPKTESLPALYGIDLANPFFLSFLAGAAFVAFFSVTRFNRRSRDEADPVTAESRLLDRLTPADLRDHRLIAQAYTLYASVLLGVYVALTFYGRIILDWVNNVLPTAGYTDTSKFDFGSPQWPLMAALAMIGVLPVLPPVEALEVRLRHWTHRAVGIPLTIYRHSEAMRGQLRRLRGVGPGEVPDFEADIPDWVRGIADPFTIVYAFEARADLILLTPWVPAAARRGCPVERPLRLRRGSAPVPRPCPPRRRGTWHRRVRSDQDRRLPPDPLRRRERCEAPPGPRFPPSGARSSASRRTLFAGSALRDVSMTYRPEGAKWRPKGRRKPSKRAVYGGSDTTCHGRHLEHFGPGLTH